MVSKAGTMKKHSFTLLFLVVAAFCHAQVSIHDAYIMLGSFGEGNVTSSLADFKKLAPGSSLLNNDWTGFHQVANAYDDTYNMKFSALIALNFFNKEKTSLRTNPLLRVGVTYRTGSYLNCYFEKETHVPYDTLTSSQSGQSTYIDSITRIYYDMNYIADQVRLEGSLIYRTNPQARWTLYGGVGAGIGYIINSRTEIHHGVGRYAKSINNESYYLGFDGDISETETIRNRRSALCLLYLPFGFDVRLGNKREFWKQLHLFYELSPGLLITSVPELRMLVNSDFEFGFGLRVNW
jgi:hypothetical protein